MRPGEDRLIHAMFRSGPVARLRRALPIVVLAAGFGLPEPAAARNTSPTPAPDDPHVALSPDNGATDPQGVITDRRGQGKFSTAEIATLTFTRQSVPPVAPTIGAVHPGDEALTVVWEAPSGVSDITAYDVRYILTSADETVDSNWTVEEDIWAGEERHHVVAGLTNDSGHDVQVRAVTDIDGSWSATVAGTPAEPGDSPATSADLPLEVPLGASIGIPKDVDFFSFTVRRTTFVSLFTRGAVDTNGTLYDGNGNYTGYNDDEVELEELNFLIESILDPGTYYLEVRAFFLGTGSYTVHAETIPDTTGIDDAQAVAVDAVHRGVFEEGGDEDYFQFTLLEETDLVIRSGPPITDMVGELLDSDGASITVNDDGFVPGTSLQFLMRRKLGAGTYYVKVKAFSEEETGQYSLHVETVTEPGSAIADAAALGFEQLAAGRIDPSTDADFFRIDLSAATHVLARAVSNTVDIDGALLDGNGDPVEANVFEHTFTGDGPIGFTLSDRLEAGTHYVKVTRSGGDSTGGYAMRMLEDEDMNEVVARCSALTAPFSDPLSGCQWNLKNTGQFGGRSGEDIRVEDVWAGGNMGAGIGVAVVDGGLDEVHPDLRENVDAARGHDYTDGDGLLDHGGFHGTGVAGLIAARDNELGGRGVAPRATVYGYNLVRSSSDLNEADAMTRNMAATAVSNNSWGPPDGPGLDPAPAVWEMAVDDGVETGYGGKGIVYLWAGGNGGLVDDDSNFDEYANYYGVVAVCAVTDRGRRSGYSERGANLWICAPSSGGNARVFTTYNYGRYSADFGGTSAAAPTVAGVVALVRAANPALTWRDVKLILAASARKNHRSSSGWRTGASKYGASGRYHFNHEYGFGVVHAKAAVGLADGWANVPPFIETDPAETAPGLVIPDATFTPGATVTSVVEIGTEVEFIEFVEVIADFDAAAFRDLRVELVSPSNTVSTLARPSRSTRGIDSDFRFGSARHLGEDPAGTWTLRITDHLAADKATLRSWSLKIYGHRSTPGAPAVPVATPGQRALTLLWAAPSTVGAAEVTSYDVRYIPSDATDKADNRWTDERDVWTSGALSHTVTGLQDGLAYDVQVRGVNAKGRGAWSASATATTLPNAAPEFNSSPAFDAAENQRSVDTVRASDSDAEDSVTGYAIVVGADARFFSIGPASGVLTFDSTPNFEDTQDANGDGRYLVGVQATSGTAVREKTATQSIWVTVTDVGGEKPAAPSAPNVSAASVSSLNVNWTAPDNAGPAITDYDYRHRTALPAGNWTEIKDTTSTALSATIGSLAENTTYDVQVRATNDEGAGGWSASGTGSTDADPLPGAPALDVAMVNGAELELRFDRPLNEMSVPAPEDFTVVVDDGAGTALPGLGRYAGSGAGGWPLAASAAGVRGTTLAVTAVEVRGAAVVLTLDREIPHGMRVTVSYTPGAAPLQDQQGMAVPPISSESVVETALSVVDAEAVEGDALRFPVRLSRAVASAVTVDWALMPGSAAPGTDYTGPLAGSLVIEPGESAGTIAVPTAPDAAVEGDETFTLTLTEPLDFPHWALVKTATATGTIKDRRTNPGGGSGGGGANRPPVVEREIDDQTLEVGEVLDLDIRLNFYDRNQRALDYTVESADPSVATVEVDRNGVLTFRGVKRGVTAVTVTAADRRDERASDTFVVTVRGPALVALVPRAADPMREGFVRVINHGDEPGELSIEAIDDTGARHGPITLSIEGGETAHFNSGDLEDGNAAKGLPEGLGPGEGDWRLVLDSDLDFEVLSYIRTEDGFLTAMHDTVPVRDGAYDVAIFNPGSNPNQVSHLRLINPGGAVAEVTVTGVDDAGASPGTSVEFEMPAGQSLTLTASDLEAGIGVEGALGDGMGKWRLRAIANEPLVAMSLLSSPTGHLTNLSTVPRTPDDEHGVHVAPLFPSASDPLGRQGFVRVVNRSGESGTVSIEAFDDGDLSYPPVTLALNAKQTRHFNSDDLELGNATKGLSGSTGAGVGDWRLVLSSELDIRVLAYIRTSDGLLTSMHDVAPKLEGAHRVAIFNPGSNPNQVSGLRLVNPGTEDAAVTIAGIDDAGVSPGREIVLTIPAGASRALDAETLESGGEGIAGALHDGAGKWRLTVDSDRPIVVMSLLSSPTGHLTNLSTAPDRGGM